MRDHKNPRNKLGRIRSEQRSQDRVTDWETRQQLQRRRGAVDPQVKGAARTRKTPTCPVCRDVNALHTRWITLPLCRGCWNKAGCPSVEEAETIAEAARVKNLEHDAGDAEGPW